MKQLLLSLILLLGLVGGEASAQERLHRIHQFATLNTIAGDFAMQPNECRKAHDIDWGRNVGSITKRYGHDSVSYIAGQDSAIGLYGAYYSDGTQQLIVVSDSAGVGWGNVYASPKGKAHFMGINSWYFDRDGQFKNEYEYLDSFYVPDSSAWYEVGFTTDADATPFEIMYGMRDTINAHVVLSLYLLATTDVGSPYRWIVTEAAEGLSIQARGDTTMSVDTVAVYSSLIWSYFAVLNKPSFAMYGDVVFGVNGSHKGIAYNGDVCRSWPLNAPGEPTIVPLTASGPLDGEFRYTCTYLRGLGAGDSSYTTAGTVTMPVRVRNGQILVKDFQWVGADTIDASPDSVGVVVRRTRANPGRLDQRDSAFLIDTVWGTSAANLATKTLIDSVADDDLANGISIWIDDYIGRDSVYAYNHRYGAPTYLDCDSVLGYDSATDTTYAYGIYHGIPDQVDTLGVQYLATFIDTIMGIESNASPPLSVMQSDTAIKAWSHRIGLPTPVDGDSGIVRNLYRAHILQVTRDSTFEIYHEVKTTSLGDVTFAKDRTPDDGLPPGYEWSLAVDTVVTSAFYLVAQVSLDSSAYTDSLRWDSLTVQGKFFVQSTPPPFLTQIFAHDGRMFGIAGSRLWMSRLDSAGAWGAIDFISLDRGGGDQINTAFVSRGLIRALLNHASFNVYQDANYQWNRREVSGYWGCIAPYSHAAGPLGHYYLSDRGVIRESEGQFLERTQAIELISAPLRNFTDLPITTLDDAVGFYFDQKYMLSIGDTTYVYDERAKAWSTWGMTFSDATLYGTEDELNFLPGDSMYFIQSGSSNLYRYGTSELDNGGSFQVRWRSGPLFIDGSRSKGINSVELGFSNTEPNDSVVVILWDELGSQITGISADSLTPNSLVFDSAQNRFQRISTERHPFHRYYEIELRNNAVSANSDAVIDLIDIWYTERMVGEIE